MLLTMDSFELDSLEDNCNAINNNNNIVGHCLKYGNDYKYCPSKVNGFHCINKIRLHDKSDFCALTLLDLSHSTLNSIPSEVNNLKNLLILNISHNNVNKIGDNLSNNLLSKLIASFNRLTIGQTLVDRIVAAFPSLTDLNLSYQSCNDGDDDRDGQSERASADNVCNELDLHKSQLKYINLSGNRLTQLNQINGCTCLHTVIIHTNRMTTMPLFRCCQHMQVLDISNNCFDDQLLTGKNLDILFNNCPSLKHLDMIASGGFNARNVINRSAYLTVPVNERLVHFVDIGSISQCQIAIANSFINSSVCVEVLSESELIVGLVNGTKFAPIIKSSFSSILETEMHCTETKRDFLKNSILSMFRLLAERKCENVKNVNIIVAHIVINADNGSVVVRLASCGRWTTLRQVSLTRDHNSSRSDGDNNKSRSPKILNVCPKQTSMTTTAANGNNKSISAGMRDDNGLIGDPVCHELTLNGDSNDMMSALLMGINTVDREEESTATSDVFSAKHLITITDKLKHYTEVINSKNNYLNNCDSCDNHCFGANFLALAIHPKPPMLNNRCEEESSLQSSSSNTSNSSETTGSETNDSEHSEKFRSWEYILEENHKCLFNKELEALKDVDTDKFDSISSRKLKSIQTPIISLQQFITRSEKLNKKYDSNTFKVYKI